VTSAVLSLVLSLAGVIAAVAVTWGAMQAKISGLRELVVELKAELKGSAQSNGQRIGALERDLAVIKYAQGRTDTSIQRVVPNRPGDGGDT
jgi:hypothetical protein